MGEREKKKGPKVQSLIDNQNITEGSSNSQRREKKKKKKGIGPYGFFSFLSLYIRNKKNKAGVKMMAPTEQPAFLLRIASLGSTEVNREVPHCCNSHLGK
jgi:hypothetical protein